jgi:hypothetical protein
VEGVGHVTIRARSPDDEGRRLSSRALESAPLLAQDTALSLAEAHPPSSVSRMREVRPGAPAEAPRPRPFDIPADAEINGEVLRRVRESRGWSVQQLAEKTRISQRHLENIEADRYADLPTTVYLRGFLTSVAREFGLDPIRVAKSYLGLVQQHRGT